VDGLLSSVTGFVAAVAVTAGRDASAGVDCAADLAVTGAAVIVAFPGRVTGGPPTP